MPDQPQVDLISTDDWIGIYVDGTLKYQGHSMSPSMVLDALGIEHSERDDWDYDANGCSLPDRLDQVQFYD